MSEAGVWLWMVQMCWMWRLARPRKVWILAVYFSTMYSCSAE